VTLIIPAHALALVLVLGLSCPYSRVISEEPSRYEGDADLADEPGRRIPDSGYGGSYGADNRTDDALGRRRCKLFPRVLASRFLLRPIHGTPVGFLDAGKFSPKHMTVKFGQRDDWLSQSVQLKRHP